MDRLDEANEPEKESDAVPVDTESATVKDAATVAEETADEVENDTAAGEHAEDISDGDANRNQRTPPPTSLKTTRTAKTVAGRKPDVPSAFRDYSLSECFRAWCCCSRRRAAT